MKVIIAGSRCIISYTPVFEAIDQSGLASKTTEVVSGGARGVDQLGEYWAKEYAVPVIRFLPDWDGLGKRAGFVRNAEMGDYADALIAIWDGESKGTKHMIDYMKKLNKKVFIHYATK